ncbi:MAG: hypothetical protein A3B10_03020 [Candidatus Doudnabacteria bacterium RIFCSPLOWO2_01_FULL_44_21]|uniref:PIN domain-containing protein n=1 Tax=Candidatus Doudnabacteria bacterium RIFCSPLOWO2_01_FULL_44_21 TaxID=1817841 RepID=A0A1F5Q2B1_9BACT|nr:MAG: hypothetical protein A3B95_03285 [Candidatus Doudnabacteria bacterium RIFCSPHIGHO2_02_FULL_43_13b]OGE96257.1 MAG: hypothetical protein A3B10_03020 [Candidatus Doudnabacteria bacterium RIFCSPLOWO2_01_FULL_44_21]
MGQKVGLDTQILIYYFENNPEYADRVEEILLAIRNGLLPAVFSSVGVIEILTGVKKQRRLDLVAQYREVFAHFPNLTIAGLNNSIIEIASDLSAKYLIKIPDAIHLATAIDFGAEKFITNDSSLKKVKEIEVEVWSQSRV